MTSASIAVDRDLHLRVSAPGRTWNIELGPIGAQLLADQLMRRVAETSPGRPVPCVIDDDGAAHGKQMTQGGI